MSGDLGNQLWIAARDGDVPGVREALKAGADINYSVSILLFLFYLIFFLSCFLLFIACKYFTILYFT